MDIGIFGGTFNPIHNAHLIVAEQIREWFELGRIYFVPSAIPPHKQGPILQGYHRLNMVSLATDSNPYFCSSSLEVERGGSSYTIDTIREMRGNLGKEHSFYFIIGVDAFRDISTWKEYQSVLTSCKFIVIRRPGLDLLRIQKGLSSELAKFELDLAVKKVDECECLDGIKTHHSDIFFVPVPQIDISSTQIRELVRQGRSIRYQVPEAVEQYIIMNKLYLE